MSSTDHERINAASETAKRRRREGMARVNKWTPGGLTCCAPVIYPRDSTSGVELPQPRNHPSDH